MLSIFFNFLAIIIFFIYQKNISNSSIRTYLISKETAMLVNNWFMMFFLSVVLIGTVYPILLEVINGSKISIGPPFYQKLILPFLIPFLLFMAIGPNLKWVKDHINKIKLEQPIFLFISILISYLFTTSYGVSYLFSVPMFGLGFFLFFLTIRDFFFRKINFVSKNSPLWI